MSSDLGDAHEGGPNEDVEADESTKTADARQGSNISSGEESEGGDHGEEYGDFTGGLATAEEVSAWNEELGEAGAEDEEETTLPMANTAEEDYTELDDNLEEDLPQLDFARQPIEELDPDIGPSTPPPRSLAGSPADSGSIPDDLPSRPASILSSSPGPATPSGKRKSVARTPSGALQPFERRFEARSLASPASSPRAASPAFLSTHSRQISLSSQLSQISSQEGNPDDETPQPPWDVIRWTKLRKITSQAFSEAGKRNFGRPTCIAVSALIAIGTSKGLVLGFDYHQTLKIIVGPGTKAIECGAITALAIAADYSTLASGHANGHIFTWEISKPARPFLQIPPLDRRILEQPQHEDGHLADTAVLHLAFLGTRHTALVSADAGGMAFSHLASRGLGPVTRTIHTTRLLGRYPALDPAAERARKPSSVLAFAPLPLGNVEQATDSMGLTALLTPYLLVIVSTTPIAQTHHKSPRPKDVAPHGTLSGCLAWFPAVKLKKSNAAGAKTTSDTKLVYCWSNVVSVLEVVAAPGHTMDDPQRPPVLEFNLRSRWRADEAIVAVQWLGRSVLGLLTISQRLLIVEDGSLRVTDSIDLLHRHIYHQDLFSEQLQTVVEQLNSADPSLHGVVADAFYMSFRAYKGRTFLLGFNDLSVGTLSNWADRLVALMEAGDHIAALRLAVDYYSGRASNVTIGLPEADDTRHTMVRERVLAMITASTTYTFAQRDADREGRLRELAEVCFDACVTMAETEFLFADVFEAFLDADEDSIFITVLEPYILDGDVASLPPEVVKALVDHFIFANQAATLEELLCRLDPLSFDLDQITMLCRQHRLYDALIYIWTQALGDHVSPLIDLLGLVQLLQEGFAGEDLTDNPFYESAAKVFPFLAYSLTGRRYPRGAPLEPQEADRAKVDLYGYIFAGVPTSWPRGSDKIFRTAEQPEDEPAFPYLTLLLQFDAASFMSMLNEAFEDPFLNGFDEDGDPIINGATAAVGQTNGHSGTPAPLKMTRQHIIEIMLDVMRQGDFAPEQFVYLDMFIARSLPKYPGQLILSGTLLNGALARLCVPPAEAVREDCQLSVEYLLSAYRPPDMAAFIRALRKARFWRVLKSVYRGEGMFVELVEAFFEDPEDKEGVFACFTGLMRDRSAVQPKQRHAIKDVVARHFDELLEIDTPRTAQTLAQAAEDLLPPCLETMEDTRQQFVFLRALIEPALLPHDHHQEGSIASPVSKEQTTPFSNKYVELMCEHDPTHVVDFVRELPSSDLELDEVLPAMEKSGVIDAAVLLLTRDGLSREAMERLATHLRNLGHALNSLIESVATSGFEASTSQETAEGLVEDLDKYTKVGIWLCQGQSRGVVRRPRPRLNLAKDVDEDELDPDEFLWLCLLDVVVQVTQSAIVALRESVPDRDDSPHAPLDTAALTSSLRSNIQQVFTSVLATTASTLGEKNLPTPQNSAVPVPASTDDQMSFLRILRAFLTRAAQSAPSLAELRAVLADILSVYAFEQDVLALANSLLDKDLFVDVAAVTARRQRGWRPRTQVCEHCKRRAWGNGIGEAVWGAWVTREIERDAVKTRKVLERSGGEEARRLERGKGKATGPAGTAAAVRESTPQELRRLELVVFGCRHIFHRVCLDEDYKDGKPPRREGYKCPLCVVTTA